MIVSAHHKFIIMDRFQTDLLILLFLLLQISTIINNIIATVFSKARCVCVCVCGGGVDGGQIVFFKVL